MPPIDRDANTCGRLDDEACRKALRRDEPPFHGDESIEDPLLVEERWEMIHTYPREQAIEVGVLVPYSLTFHGKTHDICFTRELYDALKGYPLRLNWITKRGINLLSQSDPQDNERFKQRVVIESDVWVIGDRDGVTFLRPEDA